MPVLEGAAPWSAPRLADMDTEERLAVFIDYENLALGAREHLGGMTFDFGPIADALAVRGRVVVRRAYADWSYFDEDRRSLTRHQVELIEMPQRMGASRKNAADIKMVVDAIEMAFERDYISTFVMCTGDSDFSPLVHKLRELNKRVIGVGNRESASELLIANCDEFIFYDELVAERGRASERGRGRRTKKAARKEPEKKPQDDPAGEAIGLVLETIEALYAERGDSTKLWGSMVKQALKRRRPGFNESSYGFRSFSELLEEAQARGLVELELDEKSGGYVIRNVTHP